MNNLAVSEAPVLSEQMESSGNGISPDPSVKANVEEQKFSTREMAASPAADAEYNTPKKSINRSKIEKNNIKIKGDLNVFNDKDNLITDLNQLTEKYQIELKEIVIKEKKEVVVILVSGLTKNKHSNSFKQDFEDIIKKNLRKECSNKKVEIENKPD
jgi:hypothetical protein